MSDDSNKSIYSDMCKGEIPFFAVSGQVHIEMFSNRQITVDGNFSVYEYSDIVIILKLKKGSFTIIGTNLKISSVCEERITVVGNILSVNFDNTEAK